MGTSVVLSWAVYSVSGWTSGSSEEDVGRGDDDGRLTYSAPGWAVEVTRHVVFRSSSAEEEVVVVASKGWDVFTILAYSASSCGDGALAPS